MVHALPRPTPATKVGTSVLFLDVTWAGEGADTPPPKPFQFPLAIAVNANKPKTAMPEISVIMGTHNAVPFIEETLASLRAQTMPDWELVAIDNGSTDGTADVVRANVPADQLRLEVVPEALGVSEALRRVCLNVSGRYVAVLDNDDIAMPDRFRQQIRFLDTHKDIGLLAGRSRIIDEHSQPGLLEPGPCSHEEIFPWTGYTHVLRHSSFMYRAELLQNVIYRAEFGGAADMDFLARMAEVTSIACLPVETTKYRLHATNLTRTKGAKVTALAGLARMVTRRRRTGRAENLDEWSARFRAIHEKAHITEGQAHHECARIFAEHGERDLAALHAWMAWRTGRQWTALAKYFMAVSGGLWQTPRGFRAWFQAGFKEPAHLLLQARGVPDRWQF